MPTYNTRNSEKGFVLMVTPIVLTVILISVAITIDFTNAYAARARAGAVAEQAVLAAVSALSTETAPALVNSLSTASGRDTYLQQRFKTALDSNLASFGVFTGVGPVAPGSLQIKLVDFELDVQELAAGTQLDATITLEVPSLLEGAYIMAGIIPDSFSDPNQTYSPFIVEGTARTLIGATNYVFLFDVSTSAGCPADNSIDCDTCQSPTATQTCREAVDALPATNPLQGMLRFEVISDAINNVMNIIDPNNDRVAIIGFNTSAFVITPFNPPAGAGQAATPGIDKVQIANDLSRIVSNDDFLSVPSFPSAGWDQVIFSTGLTNTSDAVYTAYLEIFRAGLASGAEGNTSVILISDGAATAMRLFPTDFKASLTPVATADGATDPVTGTNVAFPDRDYILATMANNVPGNYYTFPGYLFRSDIFKTPDLAQAYVPSYRGEYRPRFSVGVGGVPNNSIPLCYTDPSDVTSTDQSRHLVALNDCLNSWAMQNPVTPANTFGTGFGLAASLVNGASNPYDFRKLMYLATVEATTTLLELDTANIKFYALGWGQESTSPELFPIDDPIGVQRDQLANFANDPYSASGGYGNDRFESHPDNGTIGSPRYTFNVRKEKGLPRGAAFFTPEGTEVADTFKSLIRHIKLGLTRVG